jgi:hypothetical protein
MANRSVLVKRRDYLILADRSFRAGNASLATYNAVWHIHAYPWLVRPHGLSLSYYLKEDYTVYSESLRFWHAAFFYENSFLTQTHRG